MMKQAVTIQVGTESNFIATHFWNLKKQLVPHDNSANTSNNEANDDTVDASVFFRYSSRRSSYVPRSIIVDTADSYGAFSHQQARYVSGDDIRKEKEKQTTSTTNTQVYEQTPIYPHGLSQQSQYGARIDDGDDTVRYWTDYLTLPLHDRTCHTYESLSSSLEDVYDNIRYQIEDCDSLSGILFFCNMYDQFTSVTSRIVSALNDDILSSCNTPKFMISARTHSPVQENNEQNKVQTQNQMRNEALFVHNVCLSNNGDTSNVQYIPVSLQQQSQQQHINNNNNKLYENTSNIGLATDATTMPLFSIPMNRMMNLITRTNAANFYSSLYYNSSSSSLTSTVITNQSKLYNLSSNVINNGMDEKSIHDISNDHGTLFVSRGYKVNSFIPNLVKYEDGVKTLDSFPFKPQLLQQQQQQQQRKKNTSVISGIENDKEHSSKTLNTFSESLHNRSTRNRRLMTNEEGTNEHMLSSTEVEEIQESLRSKADDILG